MHFVALPGASLRSAPGYILATLLVGLGRTKAAFKARVGLRCKKAAFKAWECGHPSPIICVNLSGICGFASSAAPLPEAQLYRERRPPGLKSAGAAALVEALATGASHQKITAWVMEFEGAERTPEDALESPALATFPPESRQQPRAKNKGQHQSQIDEDEGVEANGDHFSGEAGGRAGVAYAS